ncbi:MAG: ribonuclease PH [Fibrobacteria bacterium]|nr:ribonuclease PH [Fibrobacteria bacterium]
MRSDGRAVDSLRKINIIENYISSSESSILIEFGHTRVLCNTTVDLKVPIWLKGKGSGWVTAEYSLLPRSTPQRVRRERGSVSGRTQEIQRLIGRALRGVCDLSLLGERTVTIDCDVIEADGGTRTASVVGGFLSLVKALRAIKFKNGDKSIIKSWLSAISVGVVNDTPMLDLCYTEDVAASVDMNVVMNDKNEFVEVQGTGEEATYSRETLNRLLDLAETGCGQIIDIQKECLGDSLP